MKDILLMNPDDNHGIRIPYLAVMEKIKYRKFWKIFPPNDHSKLENWFNEKAQEHEVLKGYIGV